MAQEMVITMYGAMLSWKNVQPARQFEVFNAFLFLPGTARLYRQSEEAETAAGDRWRNRSRPSLPESAVHHVG